jgi:hypothetical protein
MSAVRSLSGVKQTSKQAEECREEAAKAVNPLDKEAWLRLAEEWLKMASSVDARHR